MLSLAQEAHLDSVLDCDADELALRRRLRAQDRAYLASVRRHHRWQDLSPKSKAELERRHAARMDIEHAEWRAEMLRSIAAKSPFEITLEELESLPMGDRLKVELTIMMAHKKREIEMSSNVIPLPTPPRPEPEIIPLTYFDECADRAPKRWIHKGVFALGENSSIFGAPGSLKSALLTDIAIHTAAGKTWRGFKCKRRGGVVYFAFERADQLKRRLAAYRQRDGLTGLPIAVSSLMLDLLNPVCVDQVVATVRAAETRLGVPVGLIAFDTMSKGIAAGGGDEDRARDQNQVAANLRRIHERLGAVHIAGIGHSGKDETRGERGSNARQGDVDLQIQVTGGDAAKTATVVKANDQAEGDLTSFVGEVITLGQDDDGDPVTAFILSQAAVVPPAKVSKLSDKQMLALKALQTAIDEQGQSGAVTVDCWRGELFRVGVLDADAANPRADYKRLRDGLAKRERIVERDGRISIGRPTAVSMFANLPTAQPPLPSSK